MNGHVVRFLKKTKGNSKGENNRQARQIFGPARKLGGGTSDVAMECSPTDERATQKEKGALITEGPNSFE